MNVIALKKWIEIADDDYKDAHVLLESKRYSGSLLHFQQAVEKGLKAHCFIKSGDIPPKSHDLIQLLEHTDLSKDKVDIEMLKQLSLSYVRLRYPDLDREYYSDKERVIKLIHFARDLYLWIKKQLKKN